MHEKAFRRCERIEPPHLPRGITGPSTVELRRLGCEKESFFVLLVAENTRPNITIFLPPSPLLLFWSSTKVCAHIEADEPATIIEARAALQPIDLHREANAKKSAIAAPAPAPSGESVETT